MKTSVLLSQTAADIIAISPVAKDGTFFMVLSDFDSRATFFTVYRCNDRHATPVLSRSTLETMYPRDTYELVMRYFRLRVGGLKHMNALAIIGCAAIDKATGFRAFHSWASFTSDYMPAYLHVDMSEISFSARIAS